MAWSDSEKREVIRLLHSIDRRLSQMDVQDTEGVCPACGGNLVEDSSMGGPKALVCQDCDVAYQAKE